MTKPGVGTPGSVVLEAVVLAAPTPALLHAVHERGTALVSLTTGLAGSAAVDDGEAAAAGGLATLLALGLVGRDSTLAADHGEPDGRGDEHDQESQDADHRQGLDRAGHQHHDPADEDGAGEDGFAACGLSQ